MRYDYTLNDIEMNLPRRSWWAIIAVLPFSKRLSLLLINHTDIKPNTITLFSFLLAVVASFFYIQGRYQFILAGAILFELNYLLDCTDGSVARVKGFKSPIGAYLDKMCDRTRILILILALCYGQWKMSNSILPIMLGAVYLGMNNLIMLSRSIQSRVLNSFELEAESGVELVSKNTSGEQRKKIVSKWLDLTYEKNIMAYWHDVESDAVVFFLGPIFNMPVLGLILGIILATTTVILLNVPFAISISRKSYVEAKNKGDYPCGR